MQADCLDVIVVLLDTVYWSSLSCTERGGNHMWACFLHDHYSDVIMGAMASHITSLILVYSTVYSGANQRKRQSSAALAFVWEFAGDR